MGVQPAEVMSMFFFFFSLLFSNLTVVYWIETLLHVSLDWCLSMSKRVAKNVDDFKRSGYRES